MIEIQIGSSGWQDLADVPKPWVHEQINRRRNDGHEPCVKVRITADGIDAVLTTPQCGGGGGGGRPPSPQEKELFDLWDQRRLNQNNFTGGNLIAFLEQVEHLCS